jgi:hypothetical protein
LPGTRPNNANDRPSLQKKPSHHAQEPSKRPEAPSRQAAILSTTQGTLTAITSGSHSNICERQCHRSQAATHLTACAYRSNDRDRRHVHRRTRT